MQSTLLLGDRREAVIYISKDWIEEHMSCNIQNVVSEHMNSCLKQGTVILSAYLDAVSLA